MTVAQLFEGLPGAHVPVALGDREVGRLRLDSREVRPGDLFFALSGQRRQGRAFAEDAIRAGALALVSETAVEGLPSIEVAGPRRALALCAARLTGHPDRELALVGLTGTNGKTTTSLLVASVAEATGEPVGIVGTVGYRIGPRWTEAPFTTPEAPELCDLLRAMVREGVRTCAMEVSSHALAQDRVAGLAFAAAGFTQLTRDHLDFHGDLESYFQAKRRLFVECLSPDGTAVVHGEDPFGQRLFDELRARGRRVWRFGRAEGFEVRIASQALSLDGTRLSLETPAGPLAIESPLLGGHNAENLALAAGLALAVGYEPDGVALGLGRLRRIPGRLERVGEGRPLAFVDYAHTDDALARVCAALRELGARRLILVFGCGGERDPGKRPMMGRAAARGAELVLATSDNPRGEDPAAILEEIVLGLREGGARELSRVEAREGARGYVVVPDRERAIELAVGCAGPEDVLLVAGKGHETYQLVLDRRLPFDDREVLARALGEGAA